MRRIRNLRWATAAVIVLTVSGAIGVAAWRASGGSEGNGATPPNHGQEMQREAGPDHHGGGKDR